MSQEQIANMVMEKICVMTKDEIEENFGYFTNSEKEQLAQITLMDIIKAIKINPEYFKKMNDKYEIIYHVWIINSIEESNNSIENRECMTLRESQEEILRIHNSKQSFKTSNNF